jgi:ribose/xylose/arabinose/galactoside ABC-type transport system permease subunit
MARQTVVVGICTAGMTLIIISGGIDLSIGSMVSLVTVVIAWMLMRGNGPTISALAGIAVAGACGAVIGLGITLLRIAPFIVTLAAMTILRGGAKGMAHEQKIDAETRGLDSLLGVLPPGQRWMLFPAGVWTLVVIGLLTAGLLAYTKFGRHIFAVGSNERTARLCGVPVEFVKVSVYTLSALLAGVAGLMEFSTLTVGDPTDSVGLELKVIAAAVIGGASLSGGQGSVLGSLIGAFLMTEIDTGCTHLGLPNWIEEVITGFIIVIAVSLDRIRHRRAGT